MRISDWSSDVCSSDLGLVGVGARQPVIHPAHAHAGGPHDAVGEPDDLLVRVPGIGVVVGELRGLGVDRVGDLLAAVADVDAVQAAEAVDALAAVAVDDANAAAAGDDAADRKSTRLNSSH